MLLLHLHKGLLILLTAPECDNIYAPTSKHPSSLNATAATLTFIYQLPTMTHASVTFINAAATLTFIYQ